MSSPPFWDYRFMPARRNFRLRARYIADNARLIKRYRFTLITQTLLFKRIPGSRVFFPPLSFVRYVAVFAGVATARLPSTNIVNFTCAVTEISLITGFWTGGPPRAGDFLILIRRQRRLFFGGAFFSRILARYSSWWWIWLWVFFRGIVVVEMGAGDVCAYCRI